MAKLRLKKSNREELMQLASLKISQTPLPKNIEKELNEARECLLDSFSKYATQFQKASDSLFPKSTIKILNQYGRVYTSSDLAYISPTGEILGNSYSADIARKIAACRLECTLHDLQKVAKSKNIDLPELFSEIRASICAFRPDVGSTWQFDLKSKKRTNKSTQKSVPVFEDTDNVFHTALMNLNNATAAYDAAEGKVDSHLYDLRQSYSALIHSARTLEDVSVVWSEAEELRTAIMAENTLPSLMSQDAIDLIKQNVKERA